MTEAIRQEQARPGDNCRYDSAQVVKIYLLEVTETIDSSIAEQQRQFHGYIGTGYKD